MALTLDEADRIIAAALAKANQLNIKVSVAVCDAGGQLVAFKRLDGAFWASGIAAQGKAITSVAFASPSGEVAERADRPPVRAIIAIDGGRMVPAKGAIPILSGDLLEGACGVSGGTGEQDEQCALAGVAARDR
jgi:glc operon protein GlcG